VYTNFVSGRPVDTFAAAVRAGANSSYAPAWAPSDVLAGLNMYLQAYQVRE
jgi:hypothetical protein